MFAPSLAFVLAVAPEVTSTSDRIDPDATAAALEIRLGHRADDWQIAVTDAAMGSKVVVELRSAKGEHTRRTIVVTADTTEDRSRELAAALALVLEEQLPAEAPEPPRPTRPPPTPSRAPEGWLAIGARLGLGAPVDADAGVTLRGGVLWGRRIIQPIGSFAWSRSRERKLVLDGIRVGAGAAFGSDLPGTPLWLGGSIVPHAVFASARHDARASGWSSATELAALLQVRAKWIFAALRVGVEITEPPLHAHAMGAELRWGPVRALFGLEFGVRLPPP